MVVSPKHFCLLIHLKSHLLIYASLKQFQVQEFHLRILSLLRSVPALENLTAEAVQISH